MFPVQVTPEVEVIPSRPAEQTKVCSVCASFPHYHVERQPFCPVCRLGPNCIYGAFFDRFNCDGPEPLSLIDIRTCMLCHRGLQGRCGGPRCRILSLKVKSEGPKRENYVRYTVGRRARLLLLAQYGGSPQKAKVAYKLLKQGRDMQKIKTVYEKKVKLYNKQRGDLVVNMLNSCFR